MNIQAISKVGSSGLSSSISGMTGMSAGSAQKTGGGAGASKTQSSSSSSSDTSSSYDKMDLNKDGIVTASEKALYYLMHPDEAAQESNTSTYNSQGTSSSSTSGISSLLNLSA